ncbi:2-oxo-3-hexenedioate decarboxylase [Trinickia symbiotica]|uniref:4-oxalocrotonate decarboxylase n=1 Tax=Trinickia symbiotica TaxID=863227 RepID=A0A2N7XAE7_9BURK|nr:2-keto-4-pentenoate hydratase [Trinickia symbiotica]PMS38587.1 4-oxalocrotonate decarboxylase [Trinickia symbiotica]PPK46583.1 2-oxo-3-hexenedioate decarboxylase [Trinickia symbiotica]
MNERIAMLAQRLDDAARSACAIAQFGDLEGLTTSDAYAIQAASVARRLNRGDRRSGVKMGFTSRAKMAQMGVHDVIWGRLTEEMALEECSTVSLSRYVHPRVEPELAFLLAKPLGACVSLVEALDAVAGIAPALELIDSRYENFKFSLTDVIADNASSSGYVIGPWADSRRDFSNLGLVLSIDGQARQIGSTAGIMGHPLRSLVAAARLAAAAREPLQAGWIVMAGGATAAEALAPGMHVRCEMQGLGSVEFNTAE